MKFWCHKFLAYQIHAITQTFNINLEAPDRPQDTSKDGFERRRRGTRGKQWREWTPWPGAEKTTISAQQQAPE